MHIESPRATKNDDERILPLINVVFLLLIFFMIAGRLAATDPLQVAPPRSASEGPADVQETMVAVAADGRIALDGSIVDEAALEAALRERVGSDQAPAVRLKADGRADSGRVVAVMEIIRDAGIGHLNLLTVPEAR